MTEDRVKQIAVIVAVLTLAGGVIAWAFTEFKALAKLEAIESGRAEWLNRWMKERNKRLDDYEQRIHRLESEEMKK